MFVWADLSTFDVAEAKRFYSACFGWQYRGLAGEYLTCYADRKPAAGLYPMPAQFERIGMPSFWMSYIQVGDIHGVVESARAHGGRVEVGPEPGPSGGTIALIRDPSGAGFTCYEGDHDARSSRGSTPGQPVWHELHVSDLQLVEPFYAEVFGWTAKKVGNSDRYELTTSSGETVGGMTITPNSVKGDKEYWGVYFAVDDLTRIRARIERAGGEVIDAEPIDGHETILGFDTQGAAFYAMECESVRGAGDTRSFKWRALIGMLFVTYAVLFNVDWVWGLLFLLWALPDLRRGSTHFLEHLERSRNPVMYWLVMGTWIGLAIYLLVFGWTG